MQRDFSTIYPSVNGHANPNLVALVDAGEYTDVPQEQLHFLEQQAQENMTYSEHAEHFMVSN